jgi:hypothetical protein
VDGTRSRRTRDSARQVWYASQRRRRFARFFWGLDPISAPAPGPAKALTRGDVSPGLSRPARFEPAVLPHPDAAYKLARGLTCSDHDAVVVVQETSGRWEQTC